MNRNSFPLPPPPSARPDTNGPSSPEPRAEGVQQATEQQKPEPFGKAPPCQKKLWSQEAPFTPIPRFKKKRRGAAARTTPNAGASPRSHQGTKPHRYVRHPLWGTFLYGPCKKRESQQEGQIEITNMPPFARRPEKPGKKPSAEALPESGASQALAPPEVPAAAPATTVDSVPEPPQETEVRKLEGGAPSEAEETTPAPATTVEAEAEGGSKRKRKRREKQGIDQTPSEGGRHPRLKNPPLLLQRPWILWKRRPTRLPSPPSRPDAPVLSSGGYGPSWVGRGCMSCGCYALSSLCCCKKFLRRPGGAFCTQASSVGLPPCLLWGSS